MRWKAFKARTNRKEAQDSRRTGKENKELIKTEDEARKLVLRTSLRRGEKKPHLHAEFHDHPISSRKEEEIKRTPKGRLRDQREGRQQPRRQRIKKRLRDLRPFTRTSSSGKGTKEKKRTEKAAIGEPTVKGTQKKSETKGSRKKGGNCAQGLSVPIREIWIVRVDNGGPVGNHE